MWESPLKSDMLGAELAFDGFGERDEGFVGAEAGDVEEVEAGVAEELADLVDEAAALRAGERRRRAGMVKPRTGSVGSILSVSRSSGVSSAERSTMAGRRMSGLSMPYFAMAWS